MRTDELRIAFALLAATITLLLVGAGARAEAATPATGAVIDGVQLQDGAVTFSVTVPSAPVGTQLDPTRTSVTHRRGGGAGTVVRPRRGRNGAAVVLVLDASGSMRGAALAAAKQAATSFVGALPAAVPVGLVTFADTASVEVAPTTNRGRITAAVASITASGDTALYDAIAAAAAVDADAKTLVVLSDGGDTASAADLTAVVTQVGASGSRVEAIALRTDEFDLAPLTSIAAAGHGTVRTVEDGAGLATAFASTTASLSSRLDVVAFVPQDVGGEVDVAVAVRSGTSEWSGTTRVQLPVAVDAGPAVDEAPAAAPPTPVTVPAGNPVLLWVLVGAIVLAVALMVLAVAPRPKTDRQRRTAALAAYTVTGVPEGHSRAGRRAEPVRPADAGRLGEGRRPQRLVVGDGDQARPGRDGPATARVAHRAGRHVPGRRGGGRAADRVDRPGGAARCAPGLGRYRPPTCGGGRTVAPTGSPTTCPETLQLVASSLQTGSRCRRRSTRPRAAPRT